MTLIEALNLSFPSIISLVGAGGKTSFIFTMAKEAAGRGKSVLITTTTAMFNPEQLTAGPNQPFDRLLITNKLPTRAAPGTITIAAPALKGKKLTGYSLKSIASPLRASRFDLVLIEADGARMRPIKAPGAHEPVIPAQTRIVAGCIGLDCLATPLKAPHVHRPEILARLSGQRQGSPVSPGTLTRLVGSDQGLFKSADQDMKKILVLNKADTRSRIRQGESFARTIMSAGLANGVLVTAFLNRDDPVIQKVSPAPS